jgi:hypothetical protein
LLEPPVYPRRYDYLVSTFFEVSDDWREQDEHGWKRISLLQWEAYGRLNGRPFTGWELRVLAKMDKAFFRYLSESRETKRGD